MTAYYEPFNEALSTLSRREAGSLSASSWASGHPETAPYFLEYLPLLKEDGGMPSYDPSMAFDKFIPAEGLSGPLSAEETSYIDDLVRAAHERGSIPALACTRTLGRASAIRRAYGGTSILLVRNIFHQWASYCGQALSGNTYFLETIDRTVAASRHDVFIRNIDDWFGDRSSSIYDEKLFTLFIVLHLYLYVHSVDSADIIIDQSSIQNDYDQRSLVQETIQQHTGLNIDLSDYRPTFDSSPIEISDKSQFIDTINHFSKMIEEQLASSSAIEFVQKAKNETLEEWSRHEFYMRRSRANHRDALKRANSDLESISAQFNAQSIDWEHQKAALAFTNQATADEVERITIEWNKLTQHAATLATETTDLAAQLTQRTGELEDLKKHAEERSACLTRENDELEKALADIALAQSAESAEWVQQKTELHRALELAKDENTNVSIRLEEITRDLNAIKSRSLIQTLMERLRSKPLREEK